MLYIFLTILGLIGIVKSGDTFVDQSIAIAKKYRISSFVIGFTIVAFGTSLPELIISLYSSYSGHTSIAISNVIGSNITNICLILGLIAIYMPYKLSKSDVTFNLPLNLLCLAIFSMLVFFNDGIISSSIGLILLGIFLFTMILSKRNNHSINIQSKIKFKPHILLGSLVGLILFGKLVVDSILSLSSSFGISETILGYFIVAVGTSLPELIVTYTSLKRGNESVGIGSILGSNLFNLLFILGASSLITPLYLNSFKYEIGFLMVITLSLVILGRIGKRYYLSRLEGLTLILFYLYFFYLQFN